MFGHVGDQLGGPWHQQAGAGLDRHTGRNFVHAAQFGLRHANPFGGLGRFHGGGSPPDRPTGQTATAEGFQVALEDDGVVPGQQYLRCAGRQNDRATAAGRVKRLEVLYRHFSQFGHQRDIDIVLDIHGLKVRVVSNQGQPCVERHRVGHDVFDGLQLGHVKTGFRRHVEIGVGQAQAGPLVFGDGTPDAAFTPVVGGQRQVPISKHVMEFLQVVQCRTGGGQHVAPVIAKRVLFQIEAFAGRGHELPHAGCLGAGNCLRVEGALDKRQQRQFGGHVAPLQFFHNVEQVFIGTLRHAQDVVGPGAVPLLAISDQVTLQIGHAIAAPDTFPNIRGRCQFGDRPGGGLRGGDGLQLATRNEWTAGVGGLIS